MAIADSDLVDDENFVPPSSGGVPTSSPVAMNVDDDPTISVAKASEAPLVTSTSEDTASTKDNSEFTNMDSPKQENAVESTSSSVIFQEASIQPYVEPSIQKPLSGALSGETIYSLRVPGVGKILALKSELACDVDDLYEDSRVVCDVDAYVDGSSDDEEEESVYPQYTSANTVATGFSLDDDLEAGGNNLPHLDPHSDPFAHRVGKKLSWHNVNMKLQSKKGKPSRMLLDGVWGEVPATETTAIMGASGAGKTSLLNILAGRARTRGRIKIEADVRLENYIVDPTNINVRKSIAFVAQDDSLQATATPREAIRFSAKLRLPRSTTDSQLDMLTNRMIKELGLTSCADTIVGGPLIKGISGGERKRASVGVELVVKPTMVFLDEPTSGLDSFSAVQVCQVLKKVANAGASVLFTIHQPSSEIFDSFDRLILLHKGRVLFQGSVKSVPSTFAAWGYPLPENYNPADWVINVAQRYPIADLEASGFFQSDTRDVPPPTAPLKGQNAWGEPVRTYRFHGDKSEEPPGIWVQTSVLCKREIAYMYRFPQPLYARFGFTAFLSSLIGTIFFNVGKASTADYFNISSQFGALMILLMLAMLGTAQPAILFFPEERPIFLREYSTDHYSVFSYFISRLMVEMMNTGIQVIIMVVIIYNMVSFNGSIWMYFATTYALAMSGTAMAVTLGVLAQGNAKVAQQFLPVLFIPQLLFSGFFVSPSLIPEVLQWMQYICVLTYAVRLIVIEEFQDCSDNSYENQNCQLLIDNVRADPDKTLFYWMMLVVSFVVFRTLALSFLRKSASKFF